MAIDISIPVSKAADILEVHPSRVRAMVNAGQLNAEKVAGRWFISRSSLDERCSVDAPDGRPFSSSNAWALLCLAEGKQANWVDKSVQSRLKGHLKRRSWGELVPRLRSRARSISLRAHPSALNRLVQEPGVISAGVSAASSHGIDIQASSELEAYLYESRANELIQRYKMEPSERANVILHVVPDDVPPDWQDCVGGVVAAIDLVQSRNPRSQKAGSDYLRRLARNEANADGSPASI